MPDTRGSSSDARCREGLTRVSTRSSLRRMSGGTGTSRRSAPRRQLLVAVGAPVLAVLLVAGPAAAASGDGGVTFTGSLDDRALSSIDANSPAELDPERGTVLTVEVENERDDPVEIRNVRLSATVLGLAFLNYTTRIDLVVEPGEPATRTFALDLGDLGGQARGLLPGAVELLDPERQVVAAQDVPLDVKGSLRSVYGVFGLGIAAITALLFLSLLVRLGAGRLPVNRWSRAWRFAVPGVGLGLTLSLTLSALELALPSRTLSLALVVARRPGRARRRLPHAGTGRRQRTRGRVRRGLRGHAVDAGRRRRRRTAVLAAGPGRARRRRRARCPPAPGARHGRPAPAPPTLGGPGSSARPTL